MLTGRLDGLKMAAEKDSRVLDFEVQLPSPT
jgi:hypothetical protein